MSINTSKIPSMLRAPKSHTRVDESVQKLGEHKITIPSALRKATQRGVAPSVPSVLAKPRSSEQKNWMQGLISRTYAEAYPIMQKQRVPFRVVQVDDVILDNKPSRRAGELLVSVSTPENFHHTSTDNNDKSIDRLRASNWFGSNMNRCIVTDIKLSSF